jgi:hypothetical protein
MTYLWTPAPHIRGLVRAVATEYDMLRRSEVGFGDTLR